MEKDGLISTKVIAELFNLTPRRVEQLAQKKIIPKVGRGQYDLGPTVQAYVRYLQARLGNGDTIDVTGLKDRMLKAQTEEKEAKAKLAQNRLAVDEGRLMEREVVVREWAGRVIEVKAAMLEMPRRIGFLFSDSDTRNIIEEEVEKTVYEILETYSRDGIATPHSDIPMDGGGKAGAEASGEIKRKRVGGQKQDTD